MHQGNSLNDLTYKRIRNDILDLTLEPGTTVSVQKLADMYGVSRTPAREAVVRLQKENLVDVYPQAKTMVSKISLKRIRQERSIRKALELSLVDEFVENCSPLVTDAMKYVISVQKKYAAAEKYREFFISDNNFHRILFETAGNDLAWETIQDVVSHENRFRILSTKLEGIDQTMISEHEAILIAAQEKDAEGMKQILDMHLDKIGTQVERLLDTYSEYFTDLKVERGNWTCK